MRKLTELLIATLFGIITLDSAITSHGFFHWLNCVSFVFIVSWLAIVVNEIEEMKKNI